MAKNVSNNSLNIPSSASSKSTRSNSNYVNISFFFLLLINNLYHFMNQLVTRYTWC